MGKRFKLLLLIFVAFTTGALAQSSDMLNGKFTVSAYGAKIAFSKGNLQQIDGNWQFAEHQYDYLGDSQDRNSTTRDVFKFNDYSLPNNDDSWFVMSSNQWKYLLTTRSVTNTLSDGARYTMATLGGTYKGLILFPDSYTHPDGTDFTPGVYNDASDYTATVSLEGWSLMEAAGCVFLPATGYYSVDGVWRYVGDGVVYSSSTILGYIYHRYTPWFRIDATNGPVVELDDGNAWCHISSYVPIRLVWSFLEKDDDGYYLLGSLQDWKDFASIVQETPSANARMTADIDLGDDQTMIGTDTDNGRYSSTFDGQGHTLTVHYVSTHDGCAPFLYIENATIQNIHVAGTINTSHRRAAGLVANSYGTSYISNSWSSVALISTYNGDAERGGFVSCVQNGTLTIDDSYFDGTLTGEASYTWGGFVGWRKSTSIINNCLFNPISVNINPQDSETFSNNGGTITNCHYTVRIGSSTQGTQIPDGQLADGTIATALGSNWVQDPVLNQPMLKIFANYVNHVIGYGDSEKSDHWVFIASPVAGNLLPTAVENLVAATATNYDLYRFNQSGENGEWENYKAHTDGFVLENGKGYLYANKNDADLTFAGVLNMSASMDVALDYDDGAYLAGFNLVGNPFTDEATIDMPFYKMNNDGSEVVAVVNYNEEAIPALTGVVVEATYEGQHVTFTKAGAKSRGNSDSQGSLQMTLTKAGTRGNAFHDKAIVSFNEGTQLGKYIFNENHAKLYIPQDGNDYAIAFSNRQGEVPVHFVAKETGRYTISVETHGRASLQGVKLIDKFENVVIDLGIDDSYTFIGTPADSRNRFIIRFENSENSESSDFAYQNGTDIIVNGNGELQVFDVMGRLVSQQYVNGIEIIAKPSQTGVYIFKLEGKSQKIVIK